MPQYQDYGFDVEIILRVVLWRPVISVSGIIYYNVEHIEWLTLT